MQYAGIMKISTALRAALQNISRFTTLCSCSLRALFFIGRKHLKNTLEDCSVYWPKFYCLHYCIIDDDDIYVCWSNLHARSLSTLHLQISFFYFSFSNPLMLSGVDENLCKFTFFYGTIWVNQKRTASMMG